jgi:ABC-2 type transport system permease protein
MDFLVSKEFAAAFLGQLLYLPFSLGIVYLVWSKLYSEHPELAGISGMGLNAVICYYLVTNIILFITARFWYLNYPIWTDINKGNLSIYLARPLDYMAFRFFREGGNLTLNSLLGAAAVAVIGSVFNLCELSALRLFLFLLSLAESIVLIFFLQFVVGTLTFWTDKIFGIRDVFFHIVQFLSGLVLPLAFFPAWTRPVLDLLPFKYIYNYPAMVLIQADVGAILHEQVYALLWVGASYLFARKFFDHGVKRYVANGG